MNDKWKMLAIAGLLLSSAAAFAQKDAAKTADPADAPKSADPAAPPPIPPIPPKVPNEEPAPTVTITEKHGERIEEYKQNGRIYMVKITPAKGPPYYYLDTDGDGQLELREQDRKLNPVQPIYWKVKKW
jgi:hypothetical protein